MNRDEVTAKKYLDTIENDVIFEPDGNIPPDFSIRKSIGVEVRRLNQQYRSNGKSKGLEEISISLEKTIKVELANHVSKNGKKYWLDLKYERDIPERKQIRDGVKQFIKSFECNGEIFPFKMEIAPNVSLKVFAEAGNTEEKYSLGGFIDEDSGGWTLEIYSNEINQFIKEKEKKITPYQSNYKHWWLLLVDYVNCLDKETIIKIKESVTKGSCWDRILIVDPIDGKLKFEI